MTIVEFRKAVCGFIGRPTNDEVLAVDGLDLVMLAINQARLKAQREYDFGSLESIYGVQTSRYGKSFDEFKAYPESEGGDVRMKTVTGVFSYTLNGEEVALNEPIDYQSQHDIKRTARPSDLEPASAHTQRMYSYVRGRKLFLEPVGDATWLAVTGVPFLDDLTIGSSVDFFLTFAHDWLLLASVRQLNMLLKEDQRVQVPQKMLDEAWLSLRRMDADMSGWAQLD